VVPAVGSEVRTGGLEVGAFALGELVDVERVLARREIFDVELDADAVRSLRKRCGADHLILSVFDFNGEGLGRWRCGGVGDGCRYCCREKEAEKCRESFHETSFDWTADRGLWPEFEPVITLRGGDEGECKEEVSCGEKDIS
jgi:hypothetical protein